MKDERKIMVNIVILVIALGMAGVSYGEAMGTAFTYQGRLIDANSPAEGAYDFEFEVYDALDGGIQQGSTVSKNDVDVIDSYFTVELDFGSSVFTGDARWLEIAVRPGESTEPNDFTTLSPRQELTPTPYVMQTRGIFVDDALNVGIGTQSPVGKLHVVGGKAMDGTWGADIVIKAQDGGDGWAMQYDGAAGGDIILMPGEGGDEIETGSPGPDGNVGIGTMSPGAKLGIVSPSSGAALSVGRASAEPSIVASSDANGGWLIMDSRGTGRIGLNYYHNADVSLVKGGGNVGIGTTSPVTKLHINGGSDAFLGGGGFLVTGPQSGLNMVIDDNEIMARDNGNPSKLYLNQDSDNVVVSVLEITGGSDLAEPFEVAGAESIEPGMVVAIDPEHTGQLVVSSEAYDRKVAGIISGAGGIKPGMLMGQKGSVANGANPVALTGRVYCLADAAYGAIQPGDLLTTSQTPGHAMKVTDFTKANGAILGKAMSSLDQGQGLVLVLVTLQ